MNCQDTKQWLLPKSSVILLSILLSGCMSDPGALQRNRPAAESSDRISISEALDNFVQQEIAEHGTYSDNELREKVERVTGNIIKWGLKSSDENMRDPIIIDAPLVFGFALPDKQLILYRGLLEMTENRDGQMAVVIAHLLAHTESGQARERYLQIIRSGEVDDAADDKHQGLVVTAYSGFNPVEETVNPFSDKHEKIADHLTILYLLRAGYSPILITDFWAELQDYEEETEALLLKVHPVTTSRLHKMRESIQKIR